MRLITEFVEDTKIVIEEAAGDPLGKRMYIEGIFMQSAVKNRNGRVYPTDILENEVNRYVTDYVQKNKALGELNHPQRPNVDPREASHRIVELYRDGDNFIGKALVLPTPVGRIVEGLISGGTQLGVSSRGVGSLKSNNGLMEVQKDFHLSTVDVVSDPSGPDCFVNGIMESVDWIWDNGHFKAQDLEEQRNVINAASRGRRLDESAVLNVWAKLMNNVSK